MLTLKLAFDDLKKVILTATWVGICLFHLSDGQAKLHISGMTLDPNI